jgi:hypothetical protein
MAGRKFKPCTTCHVMCGTGGDVGDFIMNVQDQSYTQLLAHNVNNHLYNTLHHPMYNPPPHIAGGYGLAAPPAQAPTPTAPPPPKTHCGHKSKVAEHSMELPEPAKKWTCVPATINTGPTSSHVGVGPSVSDAHIVIPTTVISLPSSPSHHSSPPPESSSSSCAPAISASLQLPTASYGSLQSNRCPKQSATRATDVYYFCRVAASKDKPATLPLAREDPILSKKPQVRVNFHII